MRHMKIRLVMLAAALAAGTVRAGDPSQAEELRIRGGLPNVAAGLAEGRKMTVCYLGGSITHAANGWRSKSMDWLRKRYPKCEFTELNATICGTGADYGATRFPADVLAKGTPDLLFVEFRVNGGNRPAVEGIVRQMWKANPQADICFVYTICEGMVKDIRAGKHSAFCTQMEEVADRYGIPSVDFGIEVVKRLDAGSLAFSPAGHRPGQLLFTRDTCHPTPEGHDVYVGTLVPALEKCFATGRPGAHELGTPLEAHPYDVCELAPAADFVSGPDWVRVDTRTDKVYRSDFGRTEAMLRGAYATEKEGASFTVRWTGSTLILSDIPQDAEMIVESVVDGGKPQVQKRIRSKEHLLHARFWYVWAGSWGPHEAKITVRKIPAGQKFFCGQLQAIGRFAR